MIQEHRKAGKIRAEKIIARQRYAVSGFGYLPDILNYYSKVLTLYNILRYTLPTLRKQRETMNMATRNKSTMRLCWESLICMAFGVLFTAVLVAAHMISEYM